MGKSDITTIVYMSKIAYVTDLHLEEHFPISQGVDAWKNWERVLADISERGIKEIILGGDLGEPSSHKAFFKSLKGLDISLTLGNHDELEEVRKYFQIESVGESKELYYSQEREFHKLIFLDSSAGSIAKSISETQFNWLQNELLTSKNIVLFIHHPIIPAIAEVDIHYHLKGREKIQELLLSVENDISIFCGHYHFHDEKRKGKLHQLITPAVSYQSVNIPHEAKIITDTFGYRIIELNEMGMNEELVTFNVD